MASSNSEIYLLSKATAMQQSGMVPVMQDINQVAEAIKDLMTAESLH